ncbi:MAG: L,D-transpeptidase, partial [Sandaracinaceae bacterium]
ANDEEAEPWERQTRLTGWQERRNIGGHIMHVLETDDGPRYLRAWFASVAERVDRPDGVAEDEPWVHVDLSEQTLVMYRGETPIYATLVSTGVEEHATPTGLFPIHQKHVTDTMSNIGPDASDDRYSIEDVPWTQYFEGSVALHTAFWHTRFGLPRSHGCVNMAPADAHWVFQRTWPEIPDGWHGVSAREGDLPASHVLVTD